MDKEVIMTIIRQVLLALGAGLVAGGVIEDEATLQAIVGGIVAIVAVIWGIFSKKKIVEQKKDLETQVISTGETPVTQK